MISNKKNKTRGFGLIGLILVIAVIALLSGGALYKNKEKNNRSQLDTGLDAIKKAEEIKQQLESKNTENTDLQNEKKNTLKTTGTIYGKVSIGPLCPVEPCSRGTDPYTGKKLIFAPTEGGKSIDAPLYAVLASDGSYTIELLELNYSVSLSECGYMGCKALPKNITVKANQKIEFNIDIDTGIR